VGESDRLEKVKMASNEKSGGGDLVLESKHLVGLFLLLVVIFGVVFTLGYLMGRNQYDAKLGAAAGSSTASAAPAPKSEDASGATGDTHSRRNSDFEFYHSGDPKKTDDHLQPAAKSVAPAKAEPFVAAAKATAAPKPAPPAKAAKASSAASAAAPHIPNGALMLQVAAVQSHDDALALAQVLQQKKFPAVVISPTTDKYYRVQVGPYADPKTAAMARQDLEAKGFKSIIKH
jgi:cell division septation protein DedD